MGFKSMGIVVSGKRHSPMQRFPIYQIGVTKYPRNFNLDSQEVTKKCADIEKKNA
jgi:hypothetical protein